MSSGNAWSRREESQLRKLYPTTLTSKIALKLGRSLPSVKSRANALRLKKERQYHRWSRADDRVLRREYPHGPTQPIAKKLGTTMLSTYQRANKLGLSKTPECAARILKECARGLRVSGMSYRYPKGHVPANKGTRRPGYSIGRGRMRETQFKKGGEPFNTHPMWSFRWYQGGSDKARGCQGYLALKTGKPGPKPMNGWEFVHRLIWEQANGPLPDWREARLWWKDGDHANCALSNLELVSAEEHMARTTVHNLPKPLVEVIQLAGALKRKIRSRERKLNAQEHDRGSAESFVRSARSAGGQREAHGD